MKDRGDASGAGEINSGNPLDEGGQVFAVEFAFGECLLQRLALRLAEVTLVFPGGEAFFQLAVSLGDMSFFESIPQPPPPPAGWSRRPVWSHPDAVIPGAMAADLMLIRTERAAVAVTTGCAYPNGFEFTVHVHARDPEHFPPDPFGWQGPGRRPTEPALRLGVLYADGRRTATTAVRPRPSDDPAGRLVLTPGGAAATSTAGAPASGSGRCPRRAR